MERGSLCVTLSLLIRISQSDANRWTTRCASFQYQFSTNLDPDAQRCLTVQSIVRREISLNPFMASIRVRPSVSSTASSSFTTGNRKVSCFISPSAPPLRCICRSYSSPVSDASASSSPLSPLVLLPVHSPVVFSTFYAPGPLLGGFSLLTQGAPSVLFQSPLL